MVCFVRILINNKNNDHHNNNSFRKHFFSLNFILSLVRSFVLSASHLPIVSPSNDLERRKSCTHFTGKEAGSERSRDSSETAQLTGVEIERA